MHVAECQQYSFYCCVFLAEQYHFFPGLSSFRLLDPEKYPAWVSSQGAGLKYNQIIIGCSQTSLSLLHQGITQTGLHCTSQGL